MKRCCHRVILPALMLLTVVGTPAVQQAEQPWLGVYVADEVDGGIRIVAVIPGGPASRAGLRVGDLLLEAGDVPLADQSALERVLVGRPAGRALSFGVLREGQSLSLQITPSLRRRARPALPAVPSVAWPRWPTGIGLDVVEITEELRQHYGAEDDRGVLVVRVEAGGPADQAGIRVGDVLVRAGNSTITRRAEMDLALLQWDARQGLPLSLLRKREPLQLEVLPRERKVRPSPVLAVPTRLFRRQSVRQIEAMISSLERQLEALRKELDGLSEEAPAPAANPDR